MALLSLVDYCKSVPDAMRAGIILKATNESVFLRVLRFVTVPQGFVYEYPELSKLPGVAFRAINGTYTPDAGIVNPKQEVLRPLGGLIQVDHLLARGQSPARTNAILGKTKAAGLLYDYTCINGDTSQGGEHVKEFDGLKKRLTGAQVITNATNGATLAGGKGLDAVNQLLDAVVGPNSSKVLVMNKNVRRQFKNLILSGATGTSVADVTGSMENYDGAKIEVIDEDGAETNILPFTETCGNTAVNSSMYCVRPGASQEGEWVQGLVGLGANGEPVQHFDQGLQGTRLQDLIEMLGGLAIFHGRAAARLQGIKAV